MKKLIFASFISIILLINPLHGAELVVVEGDDSTPYMPYPEKIEIIKTVPESASKTPANTSKPKNKKTTPKKKNTTNKKTTAKKPVSKKTTSLERGIALMQDERYEAAKPYLLKAIQEDRNNPNAWYWYGVYHEKTGKFSQAQYFYSKAVTIDPALEPLSRVVYYPNDIDKTPLWDPKRPARVYPVETKNDGITIGRGNFPSLPNDPEVPKVPVYTPPEPGSNPTDGDTWSPALYVPPSPENNYSSQEPAAMQINETYSYKIPGYSNTYSESNNDIENNIVRADLPLYNPPEPGQVIAKNTVLPKVKEAKPQIKEAKKISQTKSTPRKIVKKTDTKTQEKNTKNQAKVKNNKNTKTKKQENAKINNKKNKSALSKQPEVKQVKQAQTKSKQEPKTQTETKNKKIEKTNTKHQTQPKQVKQQETKTQPKPETKQENQQEIKKQNSEAEVTTTQKPRVKIRPKTQKTEQNQTQPEKKQETKAEIKPEQVKQQVTQEVKKEETSIPVQTQKQTEPEKPKPRPRIKVKTPESAGNNDAAKPVQQVKKLKQDTNNQIEYLPPVGQFAPDPGTIVEPEIPPVGQGF